MVLRFYDGGPPGWRRKKNHASTPTMRMATITDTVIKVVEAPAPALVALVVAVAAPFVGCVVVVDDAADFDVVVVAGGAVVVVVGSRIVSIEIAVPAVQLTEAPPTACQVEPVTCTSSEG